jgi:hypothetical protein
LKVEGCFPSEARDLDDKSFAMSITPAFRLSGEQRTASLSDMLVDVEIIVSLELLNMRIAVFAPTNTGSSRSTLWIPLKR